MDNPPKNPSNSMANNPNDIDNPIISLKQKKNHYKCSQTIKINFASMAF